MDTTDMREGGAAPGALAPALDPRLAQPFTDLLRAPLDVQIAAMEALAGSLAAVDPVDDMFLHSGPELGRASVRTDQVVQVLQAKRLGWLTAEEADGRWAADHRVRTYTQHVARSHHMSFSRAQREVRLARTLRDHLPATARALRSGRIGIEQAEILATVGTTSEARRAALGSLAAAQDQVPGPDDELDAAAGSPADVDVDTELAQLTVEDLLVQHAVEHSPEELRRVVKHFAAVADPEADERGFTEAKEREYLDVDRTLGGFNVSGFLCEETGQLFRAAIEAAVGVPAADDARSGGQRRAQAAGDLARIALNQGLVGQGQTVRPHLGVLIGPAEFMHLARTCGGDAPGNHGEQPALDGSLPVPDPSILPAVAVIDWEAALNQPPATFIDGSGPVPPSLMRRIACSGEIYRIIFGPDSEILNVGRKYRCFTGAQRRALVARDRHCTYPSCTAPPALCEAHHAERHWADGGLTSTDNGALLCFFHHEHVDTHHITMTWTGRWRFHRPDGTEITAAKHFNRKQRQ